MNKVKNHFIIKFIIIMMNNVVIHALSLIEARDYKQLEYFLSDVRNIRRLWRGGRYQG